MGVLGFNYSKVLAERTNPVKGKVDINNSVHITDVEESKLAVVKGQKAINVTFKYASQYSPKVAKIEIEGGLVYTAEEKDIKSYLKEWKDNKTMPRPVMTEMINYVLGKCNIEAIILSRDLNIPSPIPLPKVSEESK